MTGAKADLRMLRLDLDDADIRERGLSATGRFRLLTGATLEPDHAGRHTEVAL